MHTTIIAPLDAFIVIIPITGNFIWQPFWKMAVTKLCQSYENST